MRIMRSSIAVALWLIAPAAIAQDQQTPNTPPPQVGENTDVSTAGTVGHVDFGFRDTIFGANSDQARYQRYQDLRNGPFVEGFRWGKQSARSFWELRATHVGYRDQQYVANYNDYGKLRASFEWNQIPLWFSQDTRTAFAETSPGVFRLDGLPQIVQASPSAYPIYNTQASPFDLRLLRSIADFRLAYSATPSLDLTVSFKNTLKSGQQPWGGTFGFGDAVELPAPVDTRTTEFGVAAEWSAANRGSLRIGYDTSLFRNNVGTLVWDNPLRFTDSPTAGPSQGRMSLWPDSDLNAGSISGLVKLPANSQATAYVSLGDWTQNQALIPFTINTMLPAVPLDRPTADTKAVVTSTAFGLASRPVEHLWLNARFRSYNFDNQTPIMRVPITVSYDTTEAPFADAQTSPYSFNRQALDLEASWTPIAFAAFRAGYTRETMSETFRTFDDTTENTLRLSADATGIQWLTLRAVYEHAKRVGSGLDEQALDDIGEQVSLRQFDISDRNSDRVSGIVIVTPRSDLSFNATASVGREDRPGDIFGLRSNDNNGVGVGVDYVPSNAVSAGLAYEFEKYTTDQRSRQANPGPQFNDPTRDWTTDADDTAHTLTASVDLLKLWPKTDIRFAYDLSRAVSTYVYGLAPNTTLSPVAQLPPVRNTRNRVSADAQYMITQHLGAGLVYWFERYDVDDFAFSPATLNTVAQPAFLMLGYLYRPYTANTIWARLTYVW